MDTRLIDVSEKFGSAWLSCMVFMVEGNLSGLNFKHVVIALRVASSATLAYVGCMLLLHKEKTWLNILLIGIVTAIFDFEIHPTHFGPVWAEAVATGLGSMLFASILKLGRNIKPKY